VPWHLRCDQRTRRGLVEGRREPLAVVHELIHGITGGAHSGLTTSEEGPNFVSVPNDRHGMRIFRTISLASNDLLFSLAIKLIIIDS
jgi:hypothetical protein